MQLKRSRLILRDWIPADLEPLARMSANVQAMRYFPSVLTREESDALAALAQAHTKEHGFGPMVIECDGHFVGFAGLFRTSFAPWVEILWRIAARH